ncbi:MAG: hypothetical protein M3N31_07840, partial [Actinomycetota bacterium]|nr:hypothetical protein [Actinomycetota bacterium]
PATGLDARSLAVLSSVLLLAGLALTRLSRRRPSLAGADAHPSGSVDRAGDVRRSLALAGALLGGAAVTLLALHARRRA